MGSRQPQRLPDKLGSSFAALPCGEVQLQQKLLLGHAGFAEVDVKCCVFTGGTFSLNPEETE